MTTATLPKSSATQVDLFWREIVRKHHEAKALARCGESDQADALLRDALPPLIRRWGRLSGLPRHLQMLRLRKLIQGDLRDLLAPRTKNAGHKEMPAVQQGASAPIRIPLTDIAGMIDAVHVAEAQARYTTATAAMPLAS